MTVARAVELKHNSSLISALANETSKLFLDAANTLRPFKPEISVQWTKYLELKAAFYQSYVSPQICKAQQLFSYKYKRILLLFLVIACLRFTNFNHSCSNFSRLTITAVKTC